MNDFEKYFRRNNQREMIKCSNYFNIYERYFQKFRGKPVVVVEVGIGFGGSLQMWKHYFGRKAQIFGIDIVPECLQAIENQIRVFIGSASDRKFLRDIKQQIPPPDILIDDCGHFPEQQMAVFEEWFEYLKEDGVYLCEDLQTSYWPEFNGGHMRHGTMIEFGKSLVDRLNADHSRQESLQPDGFTRNALSVHFYDGILVIEKGKHPSSEVLISGKIRYPGFPSR